MPTRRSITSTEDQFDASDATHARELVDNTELIAGDAVVKALVVLKETVDDLVNNDESQDDSLTSVTTTADAALPKAGGTMTGSITGPNNFDLISGYSNRGRITLLTTNSTDSSAQIRFLTNGGTRMAITKGGNVGIGTTTPSSKLTVDGNIDVSGTGTFNRLDVAEYIYHEDDNTYIRFLPDRIIAVASNNTVMNLNVGADTIEFGHTGKPTTIQGSSITLTGDVAVSGTVDGIDIATDVAANTAKVGFTTTMPTATADHTVSLSVTNDRGSYALVITMVDSSGRSAVTKTATIALS
jgi:hypothetical protein